MTYATDYGFCPGEMTDSAWLVIAVELDKALGTNEGPFQFARQIDAEIAAEACNQAEAQGTDVSKLDDEAVKELCCANLQW